MGDQSVQLIGDRYQLLEKLGAGGMGAVYRAHDRLHRQNVALKRVLRPADELDITDLRGEGTTYTHVALAHEFQMLASLRHPHVISVLDYGFDKGHQPYLTMTLLENAEPITRAGGDKPVEVKVKLLIEMLQALVYLHQHDIVHRDLKPDNALVTSDGQVKVLDFGISVKREEIRESDGGKISGTIAYMAPEVLQGDPVGEAADLYAVGVIAYELFAGKHPFARNNIGQLIDNILYTEVNVHVLNINADLAAIVARLLKKSPRHRFQNAQDVIVALSAAIGEPAPPETSAIRESFLQAAQFVGREKELAQLMDGLSKVMNSQGSSWLVGGESGVGKSRLLDELRTQALVKGVLVLRGQSVAEGGFMYHLWRDPLRRLLLSCETDNLEAGILKQIIPDISDLLGRPIPDIPGLDGRTGQQRLISTIVDLFRKQGQPIALILEDLHWALESLDVLKQLNQTAHDLPLLIIANYRDDEKPDLPNELPGMQLLKLGRLSSAGITELSVSMLGPVGSQPKVLELLERETEGNIFFLVEVVRALAEEAGRLSQIAHMTLPRQVFAGGVEQIVQRRLNRVPEQARYLLHIAAVAGRQLDLRLLAAIDKETNVEQWVTECANAGVLDVMNEEWRFAHDKLREGILRSLDNETRRSFHRQIATMMEIVYEQTSDEYAAMISDHYEQAGELARAVKWYARAGKHAQATYAPETAVISYQRALALWDQAKVQLGDIPDLRLDVYAGLGEMLIWQARYGEASDIYAAMRTTAEAQNNRIVQVMTWRGLASSRMYQGDFRGALDHLTRSEEIARQIDAGLELTKTLRLQGWCRFYLGEIEMALALGEQVLALSEAQADRSQLAQSLNLLTAVHGTLGRYDQAAVECQRALEIFEEVGARELAMFQVGNLGLIAGKRGDHLTALSHFEQALIRARQIGRPDAEMLYLNNLGGAQARLGRYLDADTNLAQVISMSKQTRFSQLSETYCFLAEVQLGQGKIDEALESGCHALNIGRQSQSAEVNAMAWRVLGQVATCFPEPIFIPTDEENQPHLYSAERCFLESERISRETGMEGEQAHTLRAWARYEIEHGDFARGATMWEQAREIFTRIGAAMEATAMAAMPNKRS
jgi:tetratricopeptide (TPR) repeat protein